MAKNRKTGKPRALEVEEELNDAQSPEEFAQEFFGSSAQPQSDLPSPEQLKKTFQTKSAAIRFLVEKGVPVKTIAKHLGIRYQHVRNVATNVLKRGPNEDWKAKAEQIQIPNKSNPSAK